MRKRRERQREVTEREMASTACFLHHHAPSAARALLQRAGQSARPAQLVCRAQKQQAGVEGENEAAISRRLALTILLGSAALGTKVSPADAAYGEAGNLSNLTLSNYM